MKVKKASSQVFVAEPTFETDRIHIELEKLAATDGKISLKDMTPEERIQEASKPLYLKRYE